MSHPRDQSLTRSGPAARRSRTLNRPVGAARVDRAQATQQIGPRPLRTQRRARHGTQRSGQGHRHCLWMLTRLHDLPPSRQHSEDHSSVSLGNWIGVLARTSHDGLLPTRSHAQSDVQQTESHSFGTDGSQALFSPSCCLSGPVDALSPPQGQRSGDAFHASGVAWTPVQ